MCRLSAQAQCAWSIWHTLGNFAVGWGLVGHCNNCPRGDCPKRQLSKGLLSKGQFSANCFQNLISKLEMGTSTHKLAAKLPKVCQIDQAHQAWTLSLHIEPIFPLSHKTWTLSLCFLLSHWACTLGLWFFYHIYFGHWAWKNFTLMIRIGHKTWTINPYIEFTLNWF